MAESNLKVEEDMDIKNEEEEEEGVKKDRPGVKDGGVRKPLPKAVLKRRNNARIQKMVAPKAPVQVLNELVGPGNVKSEFIPPNPGHMAMNGPKMFTAQITVEGEMFSGCGPTKTTARNLAAEAAIHHVVMARFKEGVDPAEGGRFQENTPWGALGSLALFKLFTDWQAHGYTLPAQLTNKELESSKQQVFPFGGQGGMHVEGSEMVQGGGMGKGFDFTDESGAFHNFQNQNFGGNSGFSPKFGMGGQMFGMGMGRGGGHMGGRGGQITGMGGPGINTGDQNLCGQRDGSAGEKHPVSLLMEKRGKDNPAVFECSEDGDVPNKTYIMVCKVDDKTYTGQARSKKEAKRLAAVEAVSDLYGVKY